MKRLVCSLLVFLLSVSGIAALGGVALASETIGTVYRVGTDDGADLALLRYRPNGASAFNEGGQPILMMPGAATNIFEFLPYTRPGKTCYAKLPASLPDWARNDPLIAKDPLKLYSMAYYLYSRGYDVFLANYRGQGSGDMASHGAPNADIDHFGIFDVKATVRKVREITGKRPVYIGHSMGSTMAYVYLQGSYYPPGWNLKVASSDALARERNAGTGPGAIKAWVNLDGPLHPKVTGAQTPTGLIWWLCFLPMYLNLRPVSAIAPESGTGSLANLLMRFLWATRWLVPDPLDEMITALFSVNPDNLEPAVMDNMVKYGVDGGAFHMIAQYFDASQNGKLREYYRNGPFGRFRIFPPPLGGPEDLYCYSDNMAKVTVPSLFLADDTYDITDPAHLRECYDLKPRSPMDEFYRVPGTAHMDIVDGLNAPYVTFPRIGAWVDRLGPD